MDWLIACFLWLVPPIALACCYRPLWRATGLSTEEKALVRRDISANIMGPIQDALLALFAE